jgi:hypothetical protein
MEVYEHEHDLLEDTVYSHLVSLWSEVSDAYVVKKEEQSSIYTLRKVRTIRGCLEGLTLMI